MLQETDRLIQCIRQMMALQWEVKVSHVHREVNICADGLAEMSFGLATYIVLYDSCPNHIKDRFLFDLSRVGTPRLIVL
jgi:hypothetical protein